MAMHHRMEALVTIQTPLDALFLTSLYTSVFLCGGTIMLVVFRVLRNTEKKKKGYGKRRYTMYYMMIFGQSMADLLQGGMVVFWTVRYSFKVKYFGISLFLLSCMLTAYLAVYWMNAVFLRLRAQELLKKRLFKILTACSFPAILMSMYLIAVKNSSTEISSLEWLIYCGTKVVAQSVFCLVVVICLLKVHYTNQKFISETTRRAHRKVAIGLAYKSLGSLFIAFFSVYTIFGVWSYGSLLNYMKENPWWERIYFLNTNIFSAANGIVTCWILSGIIFNTPKSTPRPEISRGPTSRAGTQLSEMFENSTV